MLDRLRARFPLPYKENRTRVRLQQIFDARKPIAPNYDSLTGAAAALRTNEVAPAGFVETVRARNPDGYIVAAGAGLAFALPSFFPEGVTPKGIIIADINPGVVAVGRLFVKELAQSRTFEQLYRNLLGLSLDEIKEKALNFLANDRDEAYRENARDALLSGYRMLIGESPANGVDIAAAIRERYNDLKRLAREGNIVVNFADITDPDFIATVRSIPDFSDGTNMVYISNIKRYAELRGEGENMRRLVEYAEGARGTIVIDSDHRNKYQLQVHDSFAN